MNTAGIEGVYIHCFQGLTVNKTMSTDQIRFRPLLLSPSSLSRTIPSSFLHQNINNG